jgi:hypothetical protein
MSQSYSSNCFSTANVIETDMQNVENNFDALRSLFSGSSAPTSPDAGQLWYDTGSSSVKIRYNSSWVEWWDMDGQCVAPGQVKTDSLAAGLLSTDSTGRSKMANGFIKSSHVEDVDVTKITNLNKSVVLITNPVRRDEYGVAQPAIGGSTAQTAQTFVSRIYIPNSGATKLRGSFMGGINGKNMVVKVTVGTCTVEMATFPRKGSTYVDSSTYIDVTAFLGTVQSLSFGGDYVPGCLTGYILYLTT